MLIHFVDKVQASKSGNERYRQPENGLPFGTIQVFAPGLTGAELAQNDGVRLDPESPRTGTCQTGHRTLGIRATSLLPRF